MANNITTLSRHIIDTADPGLILASDLKVEDVRWVAPLAVAGDQAIIQDSTGKIIWESVANEPNYIERDFINELAVGGYKVPTLDSGTLYIRLTKPWTLGYSNVFP